MSRPQTFGDFTCAHCHHMVSSAYWLSGVHNRNHCPYCLWSRHLDLYTAGDRLSACKAPMRPVALTTKRSRNKYARGRGELMLVHLCVECSDVSINRIAADDDAHTLLEVFDASFALPACTRDLLLEAGVEILLPENRSVVQLQFFGSMTHARLTEIA